MADVKKTVSTLLNDNPTHMTMLALYNEMGSDFRSRVPSPTLDNVKEFGQAILQDPNTLNEFATSMVNKFAMSIFNATLIENRLKRFKQGLMPIGWKIEEIFVEAAKGTPYDPELAQTEVEKRVLPDIRTIYHIENSRLLYKATMSQAQVKTAFTSWQGVENLLTRVIQSLYDGAELDEFSLMKQLIVSYILKGHAKFVKIPEIKGNENEFVIQARTLSNLMEFPSNEYNALGVIRQTPKSEQHLILRAKEDARVDVESLASAFNMDKISFFGMKDIIDNFGELANVSGVMFSENWFKVFDTDEEMASRYNEQGRYWNYYYHRWAVYSTSRFEPMVAFVTEYTNPVMGVVVDPVTSIVEPGSTKTFNALLNIVEDTTLPEGQEPTNGGTALVKTVTWTVEGGITGTKVDVDSEDPLKAVLTVASGETATNLRVKAVSDDNSEAVGYATVQVNEFFGN